jgi:hypothetical protein
LAWLLDDAYLVWFSASGSLTGRWLAGGRRQPPTTFNGHGSVDAAAHLGAAMSTRINTTPQPSYRWVNVFSVQNHDWAARDDDARLLERLTALAQELDPVPREVSAGVRAAFAWLPLFVTSPGEDEES